MELMMAFLSGRVSFARYRVRGRSPGTFGLKHLEKLADQLSPTLELRGNVEANSTLLTASPEPVSCSTNHGRAI